MKTFSAVCYGDRRNSQGTMPTDKLFTGQRLDGTGLYYYGARYYDPAIGRFISPDPIVQNFANPQSLNRYSYVFNNPMKYVDPSGLIVEFENEEYILALLEYDMYYSPGSLLDEMIQEWAELRLAWEELSGVAPDLADELEGSEKVVTIKWANMLVGAATRKAEDWDSTGNLVIQINESRRGENKKLLAASLGHEGFHASVFINGTHSWSTNTIANEAFAYSFGYQVARELRIVGEFGTKVRASAALQHITLFTNPGELNGQLSVARGLLSEYAYGGLEVPWGRWPGFLGSGKDEFLTVAKSVWIK